MSPLGYVRWENFEVAISRAKESCSNSKQNIGDHFRDVTKMIKVATGTIRETTRETQDYHLSRCACYLIAQNGDPTERIRIEKEYGKNSKVKIAIKNFKLCLEVLTFDL